MAFYFLLAIFDILCMGIMLIHIRTRDDFGLLQWKFYTSQKKSKGYETFPQIDDLILVCSYIYMLYLSTKTTQQQLYDKKQLSMHCGYLY